jgi:hypothetical protein
LGESNPLARRGSPFLVRGPCSDHRWSTEPPLLVSEFGLCGSNNLGRRAEAHQVPMDLHPCEVPHICQRRAAAEHGDLHIGFDVEEPERHQVQPSLRYSSQPPSGPTAW